MALSIPPCGGGYGVAEYAPENEATVTAGGQASLRLRSPQKRILRRTTVFFRGSPEDSCHGKHTLPFRLHRTRCTSRLWQRLHQRRTLKSTRRRSIQLRHSRLA